HDGDQPTTLEQVQTPSMNATEVIDDDEEKEDDAVRSAGQEAVDNAHHNAKADVGREDVEHGDDDDEDNVPLSSKTETFRNDKAVVDDDVLLSIKYQPTKHDLIPADADLEAVVMHDEDMEINTVEETPANLESKFEDNSLVYFGADGESFGIDDVDAYMNLIIEDATNKILEETTDKVEMEYAEKLFCELDRQEAEEQVKTKKDKTYRRRKSAMKSNLRGS
ncbi:hypothetical protein Dimus_033320, partial [Dionaea muscipula]